MALVERWSGRETRALREAHRMSVRAFAAHLGVAERTVTKWEARGIRTHPRPDLQAALDTALARGGDDIQARFERALHRDGLAAVRLPPRATGPDQPHQIEPVALHKVEQLRRSLAEAIGSGSLSEASVEDWEQTVWQYGAATRDRPASVLLADLSADIAELERVLGRRHAASALRRLTRVSAQMAGLMFLTLIKLDERTASRNWARTARIAADEAGDRATRSWVRAQESYVHFYSGNLLEAIAVARHAQALAGRKPCVGVALAAALEARAQAARGDEAGTRAALDVAQTALAKLGADEVMPSAFGYNEAQLRFHEGNAFTHLHKTGAAWAAQDRALALYPASDYMDRALVQLDRASCLAHDGDPTAMTHATTALLDLTAEQRTGLILSRAQDIFDALSVAHRALPAARELQDVLMLPSPREEAEPT